MTTKEFVQAVKDSIEQHCSRWSIHRSRKDLVWVKGQRDKNKQHKKYRQRP